jgi:hypothetical protein
MEHFLHIAKFYQAKVFAAANYADREVARINYETYFFKSGGFSGLCGL